MRPESIATDVVTVASYAASPSSGLPSARTRRAGAPAGPASVCTVTFTVPEPGTPGSVLSAAVKGVTARTASSPASAETAALWSASAWTR